MSSWTLIPSKRELMFRIGGPNGSKIEIYGEGRLEIPLSDFATERGGVAERTKVVEILKGPISWYLVESHEGLYDLLKDREAMGAARAEFAVEYAKKVPERLIGVMILDDYPYIYIAAPSPLFDRIYRLLEARFVGSEEDKARYHIRGEFDLGIAELEDHRPTPDAFASGDPLLCAWVEMIFREAPIAGNE